MFIIDYLLGKEGWDNLVLAGIFILLTAGLYISRLLNKRKFSKVNFK